MVEVPVGVVVVVLPPLPVLVVLTTFLGSGFVSAFGKSFTLSVPDGAPAACSPAGAADAASVGVGVGAGVGAGGAGCVAAAVSVGAAGAGGGGGGAELCRAMIVPPIAKTPTAVAARIMPVRPRSRGGA